MVGFFMEKKSLPTHSDRSGNKQFLEGPPITYYMYGRSVEIDVNYQHFQIAYDASLVYCRYLWDLLNTTILII